MPDRPGSSAHARPSQKSGFGAFSSALKTGVASSTGKATRILHMHYATRMPITALHTPALLAGCAAAARPPWPGLAC